MSMVRTLKMVARDLTVSPRSAIFLYVILMPVLATFLLQVVFLTLFDPVPRLGIADLRESEITAAIERTFASGRPACVNVMTDPDVVSPLVGAAQRVERPWAEAVAEQRRGKAR